MSKLAGQSREPLRIALVWDSSSMRSQLVLNGLCRRAEVEPGLILRRFEAAAGDYARSVLKPLLAWQPHGLIVRSDELRQFRRLRTRTAGIPLVATFRAPAEMADSMVLGNLIEVTRVSRDHFHAQGAHTVAMWLSSLPEATGTLTAMFRQVVPEGSVLAHEMTVRQLRAEPKGRALRVVGDWLRSLPRPAGVLTGVSNAAPYLSRVCHRIGLRVPADIMLIGCDDVDACLECVPHLTTVIPTGERIGEAAMETLLQYLTPHAPRPPAVVQVEGCTLIARGSTGGNATVPHSIARATGLIQKRATKGLTADEVARLANQGRSTFFKQFKATTGTTPGRQLRETRIAAACQLLTRSPASISMIAEQCGFSSANYFAQMFRRQTGLTPGQYRRQHR
jgi:LacI family transcriptional regulator